MSFMAERLDWPDPISRRERAFADRWMVENHAALRFGVKHGLGLLVDLIGVEYRPGHSPGDWFAGSGPCWPVTRRDSRVAATVIQWLGTNVGFGFLVEALRDAGYDVVRRPEPEQTEE